RVSNRAVRGNNREQPPANELREYTALRHQSDFQIIPCDDVSFEVDLFVVFLTKGHQILKWANTAFEPTCPYKIENSKGIANAWDLAKKHQTRFKLMWKSIEVSKDLKINDVYDTIQTCEQTRKYLFYL